MVCADCHIIAHGPVRRGHRACMQNCYTVDVSVTVAAAMCSNGLTCPHVTGSGQRRRRRHRHINVIGRTTDGITACNDTLSVASNTRHGILDARPASPSHGARNRTRRHIRVRSLRRASTVANIVVTNTQMPTTTTTHVAPTIKGADAVVAAATSCKPQLLC